MFMPTWDPRDVPRKITAASENYTPLMAQVIIDALLKPIAGKPTPKFSRPDSVPNNLQALSVANSPSTELDRSYSTEEAEEEG